MANYHNLNIEPELLKIKTRDDEIRNLKYKLINMIMKIF